MKIGLIFRILLIWSLFVPFMLAPEAAEQTRIKKLINTVINHPDAVQMGPDWWRIADKKNISDTDYDWRFDLRRIDVGKNDISVGHRMEQNSGNTPNSNWVVEFSAVDRYADGTLDYYIKHRFISIEHGRIWTRISPTWPDGFKYPDELTEEEALNLYVKELDWWENKLK